MMILSTILLSSCAKDNKDIYGEWVINHDVTTTNFIADNPENQSQLPPEMRDVDEMVGSKLLFKENGKVIETSNRIIPEANGKNEGGSMQYEYFYYLENDQLILARDNVRTYWDIETLNDTKLVISNKYTHKDSWSRDEDDITFNVTKTMKIEMTKL